MSSLCGKIEREVELKSSAEKFYKIWRSESHKMPTITSSNIQGIALHEGDWETHGSIRIWNYTLGGKSATFKEKITFDDEHLSFTLNGLEGEVMSEYKVYNGACTVVPKENGTAVAKMAIVYEKYKEEDPIPYKYLDFFVNLAIDTDTHASETD